MKIYDASAVGECLVDVLASVDDKTSSMRMIGNAGGAPANVMAGMARLGLNTAFIGKLGDDCFGHFLSDSLSATGIDTSAVVMSSDYPTTLAIVSLDCKGDRSFSFYREKTADVMLDWDDIDRSVIENSKIFHFGSVSLTAEPSRSATLKAAEFARASGVSVSFDVNLRPALWKNAAPPLPIIEKALHLTDYLKVSEEELAFISGEDTAHMESAALSLYHKYGFVFLIVTLGEKGSFCIHDGNVFRAPAFRVDCVDTTGAGDAFWAAFLSRIIHRGGKSEDISDTEIREMLVYANAAGAISVTRSGAIPSLPDEQAVLDFLTSHR